jgi:hypothetical protein
MGLASGGGGVERLSPPHPTRLRRATFSHQGRRGAAVVEGVERTKVRFCAGLDLSSELRVDLQCAFRRRENHVEGRA